LLKKGLIVFILILLLVNIAYADIIVSEVMYNPSTTQGNDANLEWVEIYNNDSVRIDLSTWTLNDNNFDNITIEPREFLVIARKRENSSGGVSFESYYGNNDTTWNLLDGEYNVTDGDFSLINTGDIVNISNSTDGDLFNFTGLIALANGDSKTLIKKVLNSGNVDSNWKEGAINGTPGTFNNLAPTLTNISDIESLEDVVNTTINLSDFFTDQDGNDLNWSFISPLNISVVIDNDTDLVNLTPDTNFTGLDSITFIADDSINVTQSNNVTINITSVNDDPFIAFIGNITKNEDFGSFSIDLTANESDVEDSTTNLDWSVEDVNTTLLTMIITDSDNDILTFTSQANESGSDEFIFKLTDSNGGNLTQNVTITISAVNDAPLLTTNINETLITEDTNTTINLTSFFTDIDSPNINFSNIGGTNLTIIIDNDTNIATLTPDVNFTGLSSTTFSGFDGSSSTDSNNVTINVTNVNDPPFIKSNIGLINVTEDTSKTLDLTSFEDDLEDSGTNLNWEVLDVNTSLFSISIEQSTDIMSIIPVGNATGEDLIILNLSDSQGLSEIQNVTINVTNVNDVPTVPKLNSPGNNTNVTESSTLLNWTTSIDADGGDITYFIHKGTNISNLTFFSSTSNTNINLTSLSNNTTIYWLVFAGDTESNSSNSSIFQFDLLLNNAPNITSFSPDNSTPSMNEDSTLEFNITANDVDNDALNISWYVDNVFNKSSLSVTTSNLTIGTNFTETSHNITVFVVDTSNNTVSQEWTLTVVNVNRGPTLQSISNQTVNENSTLVIILNATDPDNDTLTYTKNVSFGTLNSNGTFVYTPNFTDSGVKNILFNASDGSLIDSEITLITINHVNKQPSFSGTISDQTWNKATSNDNAFDLDTYFSDVDGDTLTFTVSGNSSINVNIGSNNNVSFSQSGSFNGTEIIFFTVNDGNTTVSSNNLTLTVSGVNDAPNIVGTIANISINEDSSSTTKDLTSFENDTEDSGTKLDWSVSGVNTTLMTASITDLDGDVLTVTPKANQSGSDDISLTLTDSNGATTSQTINVLINSVNDAPGISSFSPTFLDPKIGEGSSKIFNVSTSDIDSSLLTVNWFLDGVGQTTNNEFTFTADGTVKDYNVTVFVSDNSLSVAKEWTLTVNNTPITTGFDGDTTDFSSINLTNVSNAVLEKTNFGKIEFTDGLDLREIVDLSNLVTIGDNILGIDSGILTQFNNKKARITMKGLTYNDTPIIFFSDGFTTNANDITQECTTCDIVSFTEASTTNGVVIFDVEGFSSFKVDVNTTVSTSSNTTSTSTSSNRTDLDVCDEGVIGDITIDIKDPDDGDEFSIGDEINIEVDVENNDDKDLDIIVKAILFNEDEDEEVETDKSSEVEIEEDEEDTIELTIEVPSDAEDGDDHILFIKAYEDGDEDENCDEEEIDIDIEREDHDVDIDDLSLSPSVVSCGELLSISVDVENLGSEDEDDVTVEVRNSLLGLDLISQEFDLDEATGSDDDATKRFTFTMPDNVKDGTYNLEAIVNFDDGDEEDIDTIPLVVECENGVSGRASLKASLNIGSINSQDNLFSIPIQVTNEESRRTTYTVEVENIGDWANSVGDKTLTLSPGQTETVFISLEAREGIEGRRGATINVKSNNNIVEGKSIILDVEKSKIRVFSGLFDNFVFIIIINVLLVIVLVFLFMQFVKRR
tara:strand:- start:6723 stop:11762 length:5040 start_codon:yes stop_codon:yes gene_type:complete